MEMNKEKISTILKNNAGSIYIGIILVGLPIYTHDMLYDISSQRYNILLQSFNAFFVQYSKIVNFYNIYAYKKYIYYELKKIKN